MAEKFELYKKLALNVEEKLGYVLKMANEQLELAEKDDIDKLVNFTEKRGKLIDESNLIIEEMNKLESELTEDQDVLSFKETHTETVTNIKNDIREVNDKVVTAITKKMADCRQSIKNIAENKEALKSYGNQDYPAESTYFDKRNC